MALDSIFRRNHRVVLAAALSAVLLAIATPSWAQTPERTGPSGSTELPRPSPDRAVAPLTSTSWVALDT